MKTIAMISIFTSLFSTAVFASAQVELLPAEGASEVREAVKMVILDTAVSETTDGSGPTLAFTSDHVTCVMNKPEADLLGINLFDLAKLAAPQNTSASVVLSCKQAVAGINPEVTSILFL